MRNSIDVSIADWFLSLQGKPLFVVGRVWVESPLDKVEVKYGQQGSNPAYLILETIVNSSGSPKKPQFSEFTFAINSSGDEPWRYVNVRHETETSTQEIRKI